MLVEKLRIINAHIVTSCDEFDGEITVEEGIITEITRGKSKNPVQDAKIIDAKGKYVLPGGVDPHTHFDLDVGFTRASDNFLTGSIAAACGGTTSIVDHMAFGPKGSPLTYMPTVYHKLAEDCVIDYGLHGTIQHVDEQVLVDMETLKNEGITSLKLYMTYADKIDDPGILAVLQRAQELGVVICSHCENDTTVNTLRSQFVGEGKTQPKYHPQSRPAQAEAEAVFRFLMLAKSAGQPKVYVVHLSTALGLYAAKLARDAGQKNIFLETCPQYLFLDDSQYDDDVQGLKYIMSPPLRKETDIQFLWNGITAGDIDTIGTDHCPFFFETQKQRGASDFTLCPNGAPGVELRMPLLFDKAYREKAMSLPQMVQLACTNPARIFGLAPHKGDIAVGGDGDFVLMDPTVEWTISHSLLHENVDYTPYEGLSIQGKPVMTISRGEVIVENGKFVGQKGRGRYIKRR